MLTSRKIGGPRQNSGLPPKSVGQKGRQHHKKAIRGLVTENAVKPGSGASARFGVGQTPCSTRSSAAEGLTRAATIMGTYLLSELPCRSPLSPGGCCSCWGIEGGLPMAPLPRAGTNWHGLDPSSEGDTYRVLPGSERTGGRRRSRRSRILRRDEPKTFGGSVAKAHLPGGLEGPDHDQAGGRSGQVSPAPASLDS